MTNLSKITSWANVLGNPLEYSKIQVKPLPIQLLAALLRHPRRWRSHVRTYEATRLPNGSLQSNEVLPPIEALIVSTEKDFGTIGHVLNNLVSGSSNEIFKVTIITPSSSVQKCVEITNSYQEKFPKGIDVQDEDDYFNQNFRSTLRDAFKSRYGWVLQQLLTMQFVFNSEYSGVLTINSDTVLLQPRIWLDQKGNQTILVSTEFHSPYYIFLNKIFGTRSIPKYTFITHHMLMQPNYLKNVLLREGIQNIEELGLKAIQNADITLESPVCLEFEVYGQLMSKHHPELLDFRKFANIGISHNPENVPYFIEKQRSERLYYSVSFHSYLETS